MNDTVPGPVVLLEARDVVKSFGGRPAVDGVSLTVHRGETVVIIGPSGSGKTTFLRCLNHLVPIDSGSILLDGEPVGYRQGRRGLTERSPREVAVVRRRIGFVFQRFNLFPHLSAIENVAVGPWKILGRPRAECYREAGDLLARVGLVDKADARPAQLSGGQQQRVAIARALAMKPELMLFDEPTSALDPEMVGEVVAVMRQLADDGMTMVVVTHEMGFARAAADRIVMIDNGRILEEGPAQQMINSPAHARTRRFLTQISH